MGQTNLHLYVLAQALEDVLRLELGLPLVGVVRGDKTYEEAYWDAWEFLLQYPSFITRWTKVPNKALWLKELQDARL